MVKEVRLWNKLLPEAEIVSKRYSQVDPLNLPEETLLSYYRLATGSTQLDNFAARNPYYTFTKEAPEHSGLVFVNDFVEVKKYMYDKKERTVIAAMVRTYHTVCPLYTYFMDQFCYNAPVNKAKLAVFPIWESRSQSLNWQISLLYSSVID
jgi:hypothetical protein